MFFSDGKEFEPSTFSLPCRHFDFPEILIATENFDESLVIGKGGFGKVYKGNVISGASLVVAAIKRLDSMSNQGEAEFWAEVEMLSKLRHCNLVSLIGYCSHEKERILVYEYMPNGTLHDHLHKLRSPLSWLQRLNICIHASCGLRYLHNETGIDSGVIHRDVKSSNILLLESWGAKISDFGLSKTCPTNQPSTYVNTRVKGTFGYLDPDYFTTGRLTRKSDVYAFGVVLFEVLCRKRAVDRTLDVDQWGLVPWVQDSIKKGNLKHIIDSDIRGEISPKCLKEFVRIAERCLCNIPKQRPTMAEVVVSLESVLVLQEKFNLQPTGGTIFGRMVNMLPFPTNGEKYVQGDSKLSSNSKGHNVFQEMKGVPAHFQRPSPSLKEFKFNDLKKATRKFSPDLLLGGRGYSEVFLGWVDEKTLAPSKQGVGIAVAVKKRGQNSTQGFSEVLLAEWLVEVNFLGHMTHPNVIRLMGYCKDGPQLLLVYDYLPNKSLHKNLFTDGSLVPLSWRTRLLIMIGVARGLVYVHLEKVIHRDLNPHHILLDEDFNAKLGGFGCAIHDPETMETHASIEVAGTRGYFDPEYYETKSFTTKSDIFAFGVVLLETISGRHVVDMNGPEGQEYLVDWASSIQSNRRNVEEIMDPRLEHNYPLHGASECVALALRCVAETSKERPSSEEVLKTLEQISFLQE